jgi:hypothetical protein
MISVLLKASKVAAAGVLLCLGICSAAQALPIIGDAQTVVRDVRGRIEPEMETRIIYVNSDVFQDEVITTGADSATRIIFKDGTNLEMGQNSRVKLTKIIFNPDESSSRLAIKALLGAFRWTSGRLPPGNYRIDTPVSTIGIRGTTLEFIIGEDGTTTVGLVHGKIVVGTLDNQSITLLPGQATTILPPGPGGHQNNPALPDNLTLEQAALLDQMTILVRMSEESPEPGPTPAPLPPPFPTATADDGGGNADDAGPRGGGPITFDFGDIPLIGPIGQTATEPTPAPGKPGGSGGGPGAPTVILPPTTPFRLGQTQDLPLQIDLPGPCTAGSLAAVHAVLDAPASALFSGPGAPTATTVGGRCEISFPFAARPKGHGLATGTGTLSILEASGGTEKLPFTLSIQGIGPIFSSSAGKGVLDFGLIPAGTSKTLAITITNITTDCAPKDQACLSAVVLALLGFTIGGPDAGAFSIDNFTKTALGQDDSITFFLTYHADSGLTGFPSPETSGSPEEAILTFLTDQDSPFGLNRPGDSFSFLLEGGIAAPEPAAALLLVPGLIALALLRRRRRAGPGRTSGDRISGQ